MTRSILGSKSGMAYGDPAPAQSRDYFVWSNEHEAWWGPNKCGYTKQLSAAGRYSRADALEICAKAVPGTSDRMGVLPELPIRAEDVETVRALDLARFPGLPRRAWE